MTWGKKLRQHTSLDCAQHGVRFDHILLASADYLDTPTGLKFPNISTETERYLEHSLQQREGYVIECVKKR